MLTDLLLLAQESASNAPAAEGEGGGFLVPPQILMIVLLFVIMYFIMIRPEQKRRKQQAAKIAALKSGDQVVTVGGIHGRVSQVKDSTVIIKVADNLKLEFDKVAVGTVQSKDGATSAPVDRAEDSGEEVVDAEVIDEKTKN